MTDESTRVSVRLSNPELVEAVEEAEDELGSRSEAVRSALETTYLGGDDVGNGLSEYGLPLKAVEGYRKLVEWTGVNGHVELEVAESILAESLKVKKDAVRRMVIRPLKREGVVELSQGVYEVTVIVGSLEKATEREARSRNGTEHAIADGGDLDVDDVESASERLDELAAAVEEVDDGPQSIEDELINDVEARIEAATSEVRDE